MCGKRDRAGYGKPKVSERSLAGRDCRDLLNKFSPIGFKKHSRMGELCAAQYLVRRVIIED
jgi:hypothetical protein